LSKPELPVLKQENIRQAKSAFEVELKYLRQLVRRLSVGGSQESGAHIPLAVKIVAHLNLAFRGNIPDCWRSSKHSCRLIENLRRKYFADANSLVSFTPAFADPLTAKLALSDCDWHGSTLELWQFIDSAIAWPARRKKALIKANPALQKLAANKLSTGWAWEATANSGSSNQIKQTQIFTPEEIARYLTQSILITGTDKTAAKILDPACGGGHLLILVAERLLELELDSAAKPIKPEFIVAVLSQIFQEKIFGLDIDENLLQLCGFSFYLLALDKIENAVEEKRAENLPSQIFHLPLPHLFQARGPGGSLPLGHEPEAASFCDLTGKVQTSTILPTQYSHIVMNPPYLSARTMDSAIADYLKTNYSDCAGDLYTAFIDLAIRLLAPGGKLATIVQQSFLSIQRYRVFRLSLLERCHINACLSLGSGSFSARPGEKVNSAILVLERKSEEKIETTETRMITCAAGDSSFLTDSKNLQQVNEAEALATINLISGNPFAFDCPRALAILFKCCPSLSDTEGITITNGLFTCNNSHFVKLAQDVHEDESGDYVPYDKGGGQKWYHQTNYKLRWLNNGDEIREYRKARQQSWSLPGQEFYFKPGLTYSYIGTSGFRARLLSENAVFDIASSALFSSQIDHFYLLGFLNSSLAIYLLGVLNPTINFQIGDLRRLPFKIPPADLESAVAALAREAVWLMRQSEGKNENDDKFSATLKNESILQAKIDDAFNELYEIDSATQKIVTNNSWVTSSRNIKKT